MLESCCKFQSYDQNVKIGKPETFPAQIFIFFFIYHVLEDIEVSYIPKTSDYYTQAQSAVTETVSFCDARPSSAGIELTAHDREPMPFTTRPHQAF